MPVASLSLWITALARGLVPPSVRNVLAFFFKVAYCPQQEDGGTMMLDSTMLNMQTNA